MMKQFRPNKLAFVVVLTTLLVGCDDRISQAEAEMAQIRAGAGQPIEPLPQPEKVEDFVYSASEVRSPFLAPSLLNMQAQAQQMQGVRPDVNRPRQPLEEYELTQLNYLGKVIAPSRKEYGLIQLPDGTVRDIKVGDYMGKNYGQVKEITPTQINLKETVPDSQFGFVHQTTELKTPGE